MGKLILTIALFFSFNLAAAPVSQEELKTVNNYLLERSKSDSPVDNLLVKVESADREDKTQLLNKISVGLDYLDIAKINFNLDLNSNSVITVAGNVSAKSALELLLGDMSDEDYKEILSSIKEQLFYISDQINEISKTDEELLVNVKSSESDNTFGLSLNIFPKKEGVSTEFNSLSLTVEYNNKNDSFSFGFIFDGKSTSKNLQLAKLSLSNIFNSLILEEEPKDLDLENLEDSLSASYERVSKQLSKYINEIF